MAWGRKPGRDCPCLSHESFGQASVSVCVSPSLCFSAARGEEGLPQHPPPQTCECAPHFGSGVNRNKCCLGPPRREESEGQATPLKKCNLLSGVPCIALPRVPFRGCSLLPPLSSSTQPKGNSGLSLLGLEPRAVPSTRAPGASPSTTLVEGLDCSTVSRTEWVTSAVRLRGRRLVPHFRRPHSRLCALTLSNTSSSHKKC